MVLHGDLKLLGLTVGKTYIVVFDGVTYTCVAEAGQITEDGVNMLDVISIGNLGMFGGVDNGRPFILADIPDYAPPSWVCLPYEYGEHTLSVTGVDEVTAIPGKYLSESYPYIVKISHKTVDNEAVLSCAETVDKLVAILDTGRAVRAEVNPIPDSPLYVYYDLWCYNKADAEQPLVAFTANNIYGELPTLYVTMVAQADGTWNIVADSPFAD